MRTFAHIINIQKKKKWTQLKALCYATYNCLIVWVNAKKKDKDHFMLNLLNLPRTTPVEMVSLQSDLGEWPMNFYNK